MAFLGREDEEQGPQGRPLHPRAAERPDGGWSNYPGGPVDLSVSVKAYFALKLAGHDPEAPYMQRAREAILAAGRGGRLQQLHEVLPRAARPVPLRATARPCRRR